MKKILPILLLLIAGLNAKAQTKEETIDWLKEKLQKCLQGYAVPATDIKLLSIDACEFTVSYTIVSNDGSKNNYTATVPTAKISEHLLDDTYEGELSFSSDAITYTKNPGTEIKYTNICALAIGNREENIRERIFKAFQHLATFCPPKKQEAF